MGITTATLPLVVHHHEITQLIFRGLVVGLIGLVLYTINDVFVKPLLSPNRHIIAPDQGNILPRLFHEPRVEELEGWMDKLAHNGLIRYYGLFNQERIFVASPDAARDFLGTEAYKFVKPHLQKQLAGRVAAHGLLLQEGDDHKQSRKHFNPAFAPGRIRALYKPMWDTTAEVLEAIADIQEAGAKGWSLDPKRPGTVMKVISAASIDLIGDWAYSTRLGSVLNPTGNPFRQFGRGFIEMLKTTERGQLAIKTMAVIGPELFMSLPLRAVRTVAGVMAMGFQAADDIVKGHQSALDENSSPPDDMLSIIMQSGHFSHSDLVTQTIHFFAAGTETTAGSICWAIHMLSRHPEMQTRLREEIRTKLPTPYESKDMAPASSDFDNCEYLDAVVKETLRVHSINTVLWREAIADASISGNTIPKGTKVVFSPWALNRDPTHWGPDAREFKPERWLEHPFGGADHTHSFLTFGAGPRRCIGDVYAKAQMRSLLAGVIGRFEFAPTYGVENTTDDGHEIGDNSALTLFKIGEHWKLDVSQVPGW